MAEVAAARLAPPALRRRTPIARIRFFISQFSPGFWTFFTAAFLFDFGVGLFIFLFNLFLTDLRFNEKAIGVITSAFTLGNVAGTIPAMFLARRYGLKTLLLFCFTATPVMFVLRTLVMGPNIQIVLAFLSGVTLCSWPICFSPAIAKLTDEDNRITGFSISFATGIGLGSLSGLAGGYLPEILRRISHRGSIPQNIQIVLLLASGIILAGAIPIAKLQFGSWEGTAKRNIRLFNPFLLRFLPPFMIWNIVLGSFAPFAPIYLQKHLNIPLQHIGIVFSLSQLAQFSAVLLAPLLYRKTGKVAGVAFAQLCTGVALVCVGASGNAGTAIGCYLGFSALQWMSGPGIYSLLMENVPDEERSTASAFQNISGALCQAATAAVTGYCIVRFGYATVLFGNAGAAVLAAILFFGFLHFSGARETPLPSDLPITH